LYITWKVSKEAGAYLKGVLPACSLSKSKYKKRNTDFVKAIPLQARTGPEVSRRLRLPDFNTIGT
jgi:hypothetical protein